VEQGAGVGASSAASFHFAPARRWAEGAGHNSSQLPKTPFSGNLTVLNVDALRVTRQARRNLMEPSSATSQLPIPIRIQAKTL
jgi:hypothetical protein